MGDLQLEHGGLIYAMGIKEISGEIARGWDVVARAPFLFLACVALSAYLIWRIVQWQQGAVISHRDAEIATLKRQLDANQASSAVAAASNLTKVTDKLSNEISNSVLEKHEFSENEITKGDIFEVGNLMRRSSSIADQKEANSFLGKTIEASGIIDRLAVNTGKIIAVIKSPPGYEGPGLQIFFNADDADASLLKLGEKVTAQGRIGVINQVAIALVDSKIKPGPVSP